MSTIKLAALIRAELPPIEAALSGIVAQLSPSVRTIAAHILGAGGKRLRPLLTILTARMLGYTERDIYPLAAAMEVVHAATLLHDDVLDNASSRRGHPAAHHVFGQTEVILGGDALLARASRIVAGYDDLRMSTCLAVMLEETVSGQVLELDRQTAHSLSLDTYFAVIQGKTAWMIRACCEFGALRAGADAARLAAAAAYGMNIGMAFQIVDDSLDFAPAAQTGKPEGGDIREGKMTPPLHLYMATLPEAARHEFVDRFISRAFSDAEVAAIARAVRDGGFDQAARTMADPYLDAARAALADLGRELPARKERALLEAVIGYVRDRTL